MSLVTLPSDQSKALSISGAAVSHQKQQAIQVTYTAQTPTPPITQIFLFHDLAEHLLRSPHPQQMPHTKIELLCNNHNEQITHLSYFPPRCLFPLSSLSSFPTEPCERPSRAYYASHWTYRIQNTFGNTFSLHFFISCSCFHKIISFPLFLSFPFLPFAFWLLLFLKSLIIDGRDQSQASASTRMEVY